MFAIIGILVVFGAVVAGYLMEHGNLKVLIQPAELVIIGGAANAALQRLGGLFEVGATCSTVSYDRRAYRRKVHNTRELDITRLANVSAHAGSALS